MPRIPDSKLSEIRQSVNIIDVIGAYLPLIKKGQNYVAVCPFHQDNHPSMSVSQERQIYKCFVCGAGGNVFMFLQNYLKITFHQAVLEVAKMSNIDVSEYEYKAPVKEVAKELVPIYDMYEDATNIYHYYLSTDLAKEAKKYLTDRHISDTVIDHFKIGYALPKQCLVPAFEKKGYDDMDAYRSGLIVEGKYKRDRFVDRIMFPIHNSEGKVVAFSGRVFDKNSDQAKYINSSESQVFVKGEVLYNYHRCIDAVRHANHIYICEGFMDVIALYRVGINQAIATMGTAFTKRHIQLLKRLTKNIRLCMDGDNAGQTATYKMGELLKKEGFDVTVINLRDRYDPDEVLEKYGKDELLSNLELTMPFLQFQLNYLQNNCNFENYDDKKQFTTSAMKLISTLEDPIDYEHYLSIVMKITGFSASTLQSLAPFVQKPIMQDIVLPVMAPRQVINKYQRAERDLLHYMMEDKFVCDIYVKKVQIMHNVEYNLIANLITSYYKRNGVMEVSDFINSIENQSAVQTILEVSQLNIPSLSEFDTQPDQKHKIIDGYVETLKGYGAMLRKEKEESLLLNTKSTEEQIKILEQILTNKEELYEANDDTKPKIN